MIGGHVVGSGDIATPHRAAPDSRSLDLHFTFWLIKRLAK
jgi:hypothetical protein